MFVKYVPSLDQLVARFTKPLPLSRFCTLCNKLSFFSHSKKLEEAWICAYVKILLLCCYFLVFQIYKFCQLCNSDGMCELMIVEY